MKVALYNTNKVAFLDLKHKECGLSGCESQKSGLFGYESQTKWPFGCESGASKVQAWADLRLNHRRERRPELDATGGIQLGFVFEARPRGEMRGFLFLFQPVQLVPPVPHPGLRFGVLEVVGVGHTRVGASHSRVSVGYTLRSRSATPRRGARLPLPLSAGPTCPPSSTPWLNIQGFRGGRC